MEPIAASTLASVIDQIGNQKGLIHHLVDKEAAAVQELLGDLKEHSELKEIIKASASQAPAGSHQAKELDDAQAAGAYRGSRASKSS
jgi:hypothetical protein